MEKSVRKMIGSLQRKIIRLAIKKSEFDYKRKWPLLFDVHVTTHISGAGKGCWRE